MKQMPDMLWKVFQLLAAVHMLATCLVLQDLVSNTFIE
jgi:hypothetical protein